MIVNDCYVKRKIIHVDMDCFYAAVEIRDNPDLKNKPVAIGGAPNKRGVLSTCNYVARKYGLHSAMATAHALKLCPKLVLLPGSMSKYKAVSAEIHRIFKQYTDVIEPLSLDEAFLDVSNVELCRGSATLMAQAIRMQIFKELQLTASAGIAPNKFLAKVASDWHKPNGQFVITPDKIDDFMKDLSIRKIFGVGKVTAKKMLDMGIEACGDLQKLTLPEMIERFGNHGATLYDLCRGVDDRPVEVNRVRKSLSVEETFMRDLEAPELALKQLPALMQCLEKRLAKVDGLVLEDANLISDKRCKREDSGSNLKITKQFIKIKFYDFKQTTVECLSGTINRNIYKQLFWKGFQRHRKPIRLLGVGVRFD